MATKRPYNNSAYGLNEPLINVAQAPIVAKRNPLASDRAEIGTTWINESANKSFVLTSVVDNQATWVETDGGSAATTFDADSGSATPAGGVIILAGAGDVATSASGHTVTFTGSGVTTVHSGSGNATASSNAITIAGGSGITTSASGSTVTIAASGGGGGITTLDGDTGSATGATVTIDTGFVTGPLENGTPSFSGSGSELKLRFDDIDANLGLGFGTLSAKVSPTATENVALGTASAVNLTTGQSNTLVGYNAGASITTGGGNAFIGASVGNNTTITGSDNIVIGVGGGASNFTSASNNVDIAGGLNISTGSFNITMGSASGSSYATSESSNILLNHNGVVGESNVLRIGASTGAFNQSLNAAFICGIDGVDLSTAEVVTMASDQLGSTTLTAGSGITITPGAGVITIAATGGGGGAFGNVQSISTTLTSAQVKSLNASPVSLLAAPGSGNAYVILLTTAVLNYGGSNPFVNAGGQPIGVFYGTDSTGATTVFEGVVDGFGIASSFSQFYQNNVGNGNIAIGGPYNLTDYENLGLVISQSSAIEISGNAANDNTITITVWYLVVAV